MVGQHMGETSQLTVHVTPRAARDRIIGWMPDGSLRVSVTVPPVDGAANQRVIELVASAVGVAKRQVSLMAGAASRVKRVRVDGCSGDDVKRRLDLAIQGTGDG